MLLTRLCAVLVVTAGLAVAPVVTPAWAAPQPVKPVTRTTPLVGVDVSALARSPRALDPRALASAAADASPGGSTGGAAAVTTRAPDSTRPIVLTDELDLGHFAVAGVVWTSTGSDQDVVVQLRVRERGSWTDWTPLTIEGGPDPATAEARQAGRTIGTEPLASAYGDAVQVRVDAGAGPVPADLRLVTIDPGSSPADAQIAGPTGATAHGATVKPTIVTRAQWGADESLRPAGCTPRYSSTIKAGLVHHTVNTNTYAAGDSAALVRGIYAYHVNGNGWCDVGYNFLVDRFGQRFEGRFGGMDRPVVGAHAGGFNTDTFGVAGIGDFSTATPADPMLTSMASILGWKLGLHGRDPLGKTTVTSAGGPATGYAAGTPVTIGVVSGHRDVDLTECPGATLYARLGVLRTATAGYLGSAQPVVEDLYGALLSGGSGRVEVHAQSSASGFADRLVDAATSLAAANPSQWRFFTGRSGSARPDLIAVQTAGTSSGRTEVNVVSAASAYRETVLTTVTPLSTFAPDDAFQLSVGGASGADLYVVGLKGTGSGKTEIHALSAAGHYRDWSLHAVTALETGYPSGSFRFLVARPSGDLFLLAHGTTGSGWSEVHALTASSGYQTFSVHAATPQGATSDSSASWVLGAGTNPDVLFLPLTASGSGNVEVHRLSGATAYGTWTLHAKTSLPAVAYPSWQFGMG